MAREGCGRATPPAFKARAGEIAGVIQSSQPIGRRRWSTGDRGGWLSVTASGISRFRLDDVRRWALARIGGK